MNKFYNIKLILEIALVGGIMTGCSAKNPLDTDERIKNSPQYKNGQFSNKNTPDFEFKFSQMFEIIKGIYFTEQPDSIPKQDIPIKKISYKDFYVNDNEAFHYTKLGHSTIMFQLAGKVWLTDPVFEDFITPYEWIGWKRFHPVPLDLETLEPVSYTHLDVYKRQLLRFLWT